MNCDYNISTNRGDEKFTHILDYSGKENFVSVPSRTVLSDISKTVKEIIYNDIFYLDLWNLPKRIERIYINTDADMFFMDSKIDFEERKVEIYINNIKVTFKDFELLIDEPFKNKELILKYFGNFRENIVIKTCNFLSRSNLIYKKNLFDIRLSVNRICLAGYNISDEDYIKDLLLPPVQEFLNADTRVTVYNNMFDNSDEVASAFKEFWNLTYSKREDIECFSVKGIDSTISNYCIETHDKNSIKNIINTNKKVFIDRIHFNKSIKNRHIKAEYLPVTCCKVYGLYESIIIDSCFNEIILTSLNRNVFDNFNGIIFRLGKDYIDVDNIEIEQNIDGTSYTILKYDIDRRWGDTEIKYLGVDKIINKEPLEKYSYLIEKTKNSFGTQWVSKDYLIKVILDNDIKLSNAKLYMSGRIEII